MARILFPIEESWFDELKVISSYYESELENTILSHVETVFPNYIAIPYKKDVHAPGVAKGRTPDLALINKDYSDWWIIEVELGEHDLKHVKAQVDVFVNGTYNPYEVSKYIKTKDDQGRLNLKSLQKMIQNYQPNVMVIVDEHVAAWKDDLEKLGAKICVFQVFKNKDGHRAYRLNGHYPFIFAYNSHCKFLKSPPNMLEVLNPEWFIRGLRESYIVPKKRFGLFSKEFWTKRSNSAGSGEIQNNFLKDREVEVDFQGKISRWKVISTKDKTILKAIGMNMVDVNGSYQLHADDNFNLFLKPN